LSSKRSLREKIEKTLRVAEKPDWNEIWTMLKITLLGFGLVGAIGFIIQYVWTFLRLP